MHKKCFKSFTIRDFWHIIWQDKGVDGDCPRKDMTEMMVVCLCTSVENHLVTLPVAEHYLSWYIEAYN